MKRFTSLLEEISKENITISPSLLLRLFEFFNEEEVDDVELHFIFERLLEENKKSIFLNMKHYNIIVGK